MVWVMADIPDRIPYAQWINSQLSVARLYGAVSINGQYYVVDPRTNDLVRKGVNPMAEKKVNKKAVKKTAKKTTAKKTVKK